VRPADVDEAPPVGLAPRAIAEAIAVRKLRAAMAVSVERAAETRDIVIAADTIVVARGELLGKPADAADARRMLATLAGTTHEVITGVALGARPSGHECIGSSVTRVTMRALEPREIDDYVASGEPFGKAGAYAIQESADRFVTHLDGDFDNVVGFPSRLFLELRRTLASMVIEFASGPGGAP